MLHPWKHSRWGWTGIWATLSDEEGSDQMSFKDPFQSKLFDKKQTPHAYFWHKLRLVCAKKQDLRVLTARRCWLGTSQPLHLSIAVSTFVPKSSTNSWNWSHQNNVISSPPWLGPAIPYFSTDCSDPVRKHFFPFSSYPSYRQYFWQ